MAILRPPQHHLFLLGSPPWGGTIIFYTEKAPDCINLSLGTALVFQCLLMEAFINHSVPLKKTISCDMEGSRWRWT